MLLFFKIAKKFSTTLQASPPQAKKMCTLCTGRWFKGFTNQYTPLTLFTTRGYCIVFESPSDLAASKLSLHLTLRKLLEESLALLPRENNHILLTGIDFGYDYQEVARIALRQVLLMILSLSQSGKERTGSICNYVHKIVSRK